ncbi:type IV toxin-antitoxin system AbiEi family antitoxin domain-containing protein [Bordetella sp. N]|uniref:type IV toxin-antitoxin system AbiEi family antitoxin domain-containing protein n=1 Tax=Bordetella sp. N TaxID=1746199 RepID=UPI000708C927|nr:type IV toxin-antitoxin system AbiEi family antitoxin domain-containing protein [Bordetella sp. N]ALM86599.1 transcriptional regulator [Bordetella sp. N]
MENAEVTLVELIRTHGVIRSSDLASLGIPRVALTRAVRRGQLVRVSRGVYGLREFRSEHGTLAAAAIRVPKGVICLLSALQFHGLTTQAPFEVWVAIANKAAAPQIDYPPVRIVRFSDATLSLGVEEHTIDGVAIRVTSIAKTVVDCFKFRNKIGMDVALESLREAWRDKRVTSQDIWHCAKVCRVANVMRPYLESLT